MFAVLCFWLNTEMIKKAHGRLRIRELITLWSLAQRFGMDTLQNAAMKEIVPIIRSVSTIPWLIKFAYEEGYTKERQALRDLVVAKLVAMDSSNFELLIIEMPDILRYQVMVAMKRHVERIPVEYHARIGNPKKFFVDSGNEE